MEPSTQESGIRWNLRVFFQPTSVAIYGASERTSADLIRNVSVGNTHVMGIHPTKTAVLDVPCYPSLADCPEIPQLVVVVMGHERVDIAIDDVATTPGVRGVVLPGLGNEAGRSGRLIADLIGARLAEASVPMVGPNCMGIATPGASSPWLGRIPPTFVHGPVAAVVHSGSFGTNLVDLGPRMGYRTVASVGAEALTDVADLMHFLAEDDETRVVGLFLETVRRPQAFENALRSLAEASKPVIVLKSGRSVMAARAATAHSGAIAGSDATFSAVLRHYGAIRVDDFSDWVEHMVAFSSKRGLRGDRLAAVTASGGEAECFGDVADAIDLPLRPFSGELAKRMSVEFPNFSYLGNPLDCWAIDGDRVVFPRIFELIAQSNQFDIIVSLTDHSRWSTGRTRWSMSAIAGDLVAACEGREVFPCVISTTTADVTDEDSQLLLRNDVPLLKGIRSGLHALRARITYRPIQPLPRFLPPAEPLTGTGPLSEHDSASIIGRYGIPSARAIRCASPSDAVAAAEAIGYPVVVKVDGIPHKSAIGGVAMDLCNQESVRAATERMVRPVVVAEQIREGIEVFLGAVRDDGFGPVVMMGLGGIHVEAFDAAATELAPMDEESARRFVRGVPSLARIVSRQGITLLVNAVVALSRMVAKHPEVREVDINPLRLTNTRLIALDSLIVLDGPYVGRSMDARAREGPD